MNSKGYHKHKSFSAPMMDDPAMDVEHDKIIIRPNTMYAITLNPANQFYDSDHRMVDVEKTLTKNFSKYFWNTKVQLFTELSEPVQDMKSLRQKPRIHYHGFIHFIEPQDIIDFLVTGAVRLADGYSYSIKPITDFEGWLKYCTKQSFLNLSVLTNHLMQGTNPDYVGYIRRYYELYASERAEGFPCASEAAEGHATPKGCSAEGTASIDSIASPAPENAPANPDSSVTGAAKPKKKRPPVKTVRIS